MAKVQVIISVTLDGFLPKKDKELMKWLRTDRNGFSYWEEHGMFKMFPHYGMIDLMNAKDRHDNSCTYFMIVDDEKSSEYVNETFLHRLVDELVIYILPLAYKTGKNIIGTIQYGKWTLLDCKPFKNNVCRLIYRLKE